MPSTFLKFAAVAIALFSIAIAFQNCAKVKGQTPGESGNPYEGLRGVGEIGAPPATEGQPGEHGGADIGGPKRASCRSPIVQQNYELRSAEPNRVIRTVKLGKDSKGKEWMSLSYSSGNSIKCLDLATSSGTLNPDRSLTLNIAVAAGVAREVLMQATLVRDSKGLVYYARFSFLSTPKATRYEDFKR